MDPLAHTLFGAALAESGLKKKSAFAATALVIGANLPDLDAAAMLVDSDYALYIRRGWTHGLLAMLALPLLLSGALLTLHRFLQGRLNRSVPSMNAGWLTGLCFLAVWSHPALDWLNTYGVRILMPFDGRWFYGDTLFIIDPWMWLLLGSGVAITQSASRPGMLTWGVAGLACTGLVLSADAVPMSVKLVWLVWMSVIIAVRFFIGRKAEMSIPVRFLLAIFALYLIIMLVISKWSVLKAVESLTDDGWVVEQAMARPLPGRVLVREGVVQTATHYVIFRVKWPDSEVHYLIEPVERAEPDEVVMAALEAEGVEGFRNWMRFPHYEVEERPDGWRVWIRDLRYFMPGQTDRDGIGMAVVELDRSLNPVSVR